MKKVSGFDFFALRFDRNAQLVDVAERDEILTAATNYGHLLILAHGWNNDMREAEDLYTELLGSVAQYVTHASSGGPENRIGVVGVYWPSKKFADENLISGGAASASGAGDLGELIARLRKGFYADDEPVFDGGDTAVKSLDQLRQLLAKKQLNVGAQVEMADLIRGILGDISLEQSRPVDEEGLDIGLQLGPAELVDRLRTGWIGDATETRPGWGGAAGIANPLDSIRDAVARALNYTTYFQMRERAGRVGRKGLFKQLLVPLQEHIRIPKADPLAKRDAWPTKPLIHLVGHSFGGRLVASAADGSTDPGSEQYGAIRIASMVLLQAAFSHYGFASRWDGKRDGMYRAVIRDRYVMGPTVATHTINDKAVGVAYPLASALAGHVASGVGGPDDRFGGIGCNGAQKTPEAVEMQLLPPEKSYDGLQGGRIYNVCGDRRPGEPATTPQINDHGDVRGSAVAWLIVNAMRGGAEAKNLPGRLAGPPGTDTPRTMAPVVAAPGSAASMALSSTAITSMNIERTPDAKSPESSRPESHFFDGRNFGDLVVVRRLSELIKEKGEEIPISVVIDLNLDFPGGRQGARHKLTSLLRNANDVRTVSAETLQAIDDCKYPHDHPQYVMLRLTGKEIKHIVVTDGWEIPGQDSGIRSMRRIWPDFEVRALTNRSIATIKADAARRAFSAIGAGVTWAVLDSGIDTAHPHFAMHRNLDVPPDAEVSALHRDFTQDYPDDDSGRERSARAALTDVFGHGTHVAGIVAGELPYDPARPAHVIIRHSPYDEDAGSHAVYERRELREHISGIAPSARLVSIKVLDEYGRGATSFLLRAIRYIQEVNGFGRKLVIHGANLSLGYEFDPDWFACGKSPVCVEVDQLVRSGVVVVVAAGNSGYGAITARSGSLRSAGLAVTINDPGNARLAITVGSTHREMPHVYGVSYFSSKGPTGDGRIKPDVVAPGEKIISCATGAKLAEAVQVSNVSGGYIEDSGTSMSAPHVAGAIAAFLSIRREFIGEPERVKEIFCSSATDLGRERSFQGHGLIDLMRAIQSI